MPSKIVGNVTLVVSPDEQDAAAMIGSTCERAIQLVQEHWGLQPPQDCRIYVMTSWLGFIFQSAPWPWRILLGATIPFWGPRARRTWPYSAAWTQRYGRRVAIGVKPPRLLEASDKRIGVRVFVEEKDMAVNVQHVTCHELTHACSAHLRLPMWLNEGLAAVTVDHLLGRPTIRSETLAWMKDYLPKAAPPTYRELSRMGLEAIAYHTVRGYWLVHYLEAAHPGFLKRMFLLWPGTQAMESAIAAELKIEPGRFWDEIDGLVAACFEKNWSASPA